MIFGFRYQPTSPAEHIKNISEVDHNRLIDISLMKLSNLQCIGKSRTEKQILFVLEVLQLSLYKKSLKYNGQGMVEFVVVFVFTFHNNLMFIVSVADLVFYFEQEIYSAIVRNNVERLPRLWIDLPGGLEKAKGIKSDKLPFRIKASFTKKK